jgi:hypothetical protein
MKDFKGNTLKIGDKVVHSTSTSANLTTSYILNMTAKRLIVGRKNAKANMGTRKSPKQVLKL